MTDPACLIIVQPEQTRTGVAVWADDKCMVIVCGNCKDTSIFASNGWRCNVCKREHPAVAPAINVVSWNEGHDVALAALSCWIGVPEEDIHIAW
jgi:hypothetical protein